MSDPRDERPGARGDGHGERGSAEDRFWNMLGREHQRVSPAEPGRRRAWFLAVADGLGIHRLRAMVVFVPVVGGLLTVLNHLAVAAWPAPVWLDADARALYFVPFSTAYILAGCAVIVAAQIRAVRNLADSFAEIRSREPEVVYRLRHHPGRHLWVASLLGLGVGLAAAEVVAHRVSRSLASETLDAVALLVVENCVLWVLAMAAGYVVLVNASRLSRLADALELGSEDLDRLRPYGRVAVVSGSVLCGWPVLLATLVGYGAAPWVLPVTGVAASAFIVTVVAASSWSVHQRIREIRGGRGWQWPFEPQALATCAVAPLVLTLSATLLRRLLGT